MNTAAKWAGFANFGICKQKAHTYPITHETNTWKVVYLVIDRILDWQVCRIYCTQLNIHKANSLIVSHSLSSSSLSMWWYCVWFSVFVEWIWISTSRHGLQGKTHTNQQWQDCSVSPASDRSLPSTDSSTHSSYWSLLSCSLLVAASFNTQASTLIHKLCGDLAYPTLKESNDSSTSTHITRRISWLTWNKFTHYHNYNT